MALETAAIRTPEDGSYTLLSSDSRRYPNITVETLHLSCASDVYNGPKNNYAGFVLYAHDNQTVWELNGRRCRTGYIVVQDTGCSAVQALRASTPGMVHGAVYKNVFGEDVGNTIGEGFSIMGGEFVWNSGTFNRPDTCKSPYHDGERVISEVAERILRKVLTMWMSAGDGNGGLPTCRNYGFRHSHDFCSVWCIY